MTKPEVLQPCPQVNTSSQEKKDTKKCQVQGHAGIKANSIHVQGPYN